MANMEDIERRTLINVKLAVSSISGGNDSRKRQERRIIFKLCTTHPYGLNERFPFI